MTAYELIISLEPSTFEKMMSLGLLRSTVQRDIEIYEYYLNERKTNGYCQARTNTAEHFYLCEDNIAKIIRKMK